MYCSVEDIVREFKGITFYDEYAPIPSGIKTATTKQDLEQWIEQESDYIDSYVAKVYHLPIAVDKKSALNVLKRICIFRVSARVKNKNELKEQVNQLNSDEKFLENKIMTPNDDLKMIANKTLILVGVPQIDPSGGIAYSDSDGDCCPKVFDTCKQQW